MDVERVSWRESILVGSLAFGLIGTASALGILVGFVYYIRTDTSLAQMLDPTIVACAFFAATFAGTFAWRGIVATKDATRGRAAAAGLITGLLAHPLCWLFWGIFTLARRSLVPGGPSNLLAIFYVFLWFSIASLGLLGWISGPIGALIGAIVQDGRSWRSRRSAAARGS